MPINYKVLGQVAPAAATTTTVYTVPAATQAVVSTLAVCNRGLGGLFRLAVRPLGATLTNQHYIIYDNYVNQSDTVFLTLGATMSGTDVLSVFVNTSTFSLTAFGSEIILHGETILLFRLM
jgi:hypothetical protein